ncbi:KTSC domain-containing protein [Thermoflexus sp.]|uniref:KTSC domain-containing protein n=1 Tax=Thermoflexus sp. TaxID=1969742 RepID=UPI0035E41897
MATWGWVEYDPETDALHLCWKGMPEGSIRMEIRGEEGRLTIAPLRKWRPILEALGLSPEVRGSPAGWIGVDSSMISAVRYDAERGILEVAFNKGVYLYFGVPQEIFEELLRADSKGRYMRQHIIDRYPWIRKSRLRLSATSAPD